MNDIPTKKTDETTVVLFPKGPARVSDTFEIAFHGIMRGKKSIIGRYSIVPLTDRNPATFQTFVRSLKPFLNRNYTVVPGTRSAFVLPKSTNSLEFAVAIDYDKANTYFKSAEEMNIRGSILSIDFIRLLLKTQLQRAGVQI